jgi:hypothetical protein
VFHAAGAEPLLRQLEAAAFLADQVRHRHPHIVEDDLPRPVAHHGLVRGAELHAGRVHIHQEAGDAAMRALGAIGRRHQLHEVRLVGAGNEPVPLMT